MTDEERDKFGAAATFVFTLWICIGVGVLFGFWWGFTVAPIAFIAIARSIDQ